LALEVFVGAIRHYLGAYLVELAGADVVVFTGGIGENSAQVRSRVCQDLQFAGIELDEPANAQASGECAIGRGSTQVWIVPTNEELVVARQARQLLEAG
jgi:acetate kinase